MKRYFSFMTAAVLAAGLAFVSCEKPGPDNGDDQQQEAVDPVFPEAVTEALEAGGSHTLSIEPNTDWEIELKYEKESTGWFWIMDGNSQVYSLRGKAGDKVDVTVCAGEQTDFDTVHSCTLEMTMGEETKTIATFTRGTVDRTFSLAYCEVEENGGDYVYNETEGSELKYEYGAVLEGEIPEVPLTWIMRTQDYRRSVLITANFDWQLKSKPEWMLDLKVTGGEAGQQVEIEFEGDPMVYPLKDAEAEIVFCAKENRDAVYTYKVKIPGCEGIFEISGFEAETKANVAGEMFKRSMMDDEGSWLPAELGVTGTVFGLDGVKIYTFAYVVDDPLTGSRLWDSSEDNVNWVKPVLAPWSSEAGVIQSRDLNITVAVNEGDAREAYVFAIPASEAPEYAYSIFPDGKTMDEKYSGYVVTHIAQEGIDPGPGTDPDPEPEPEPEVEPITFQMTTKYGQKIPSSMATLVEVTADNMESLGAGYKTKYGFNLSDYCTTSATYVLTYHLDAYPAGQQNMTALDVPDFDGTTLQTICNPENGKEWLSYEISEGTINVWMKEPEADASQKFGVIQMFISMARSYTIICLPEL